MMASLDKSLLVNIYGQSMARGWPENPQGLIDALLQEVERQGFAIVPAVELEP